METRQKCREKQDPGSGEVSVWLGEGKQRALHQSSEAEPRLCSPLRPLVKPPHFHTESGIAGLAAVAVWGQWFSVLTVKPVRNTNRPLPGVSQTVFG